MEPLLLPTREGYDRWAEVYDGEGNPLVELEEPEIDRRLGDIVGLDVLDVGCGTGRHALRLAARGALVEHDLAQPLPFAGASFDRVVCGLVVDHIAPLSPFLAELGRVCRQGGSVLVSVMHPAMMLKGVQARFTDPATGQETRPASQAHKLSDYVTAALDAGLRPRDLVERAPDEALAARVPRAARYVGWPLLFLMVLSPAT